MTFKILTIFPNFFDGFKQYSIIKNALNNNLIKIEVINFRDFSTDKHKKVDDYQIGGGGGMVLSIQPIIDCLRQIKTKDSKVILLSPQGKVFNQTISQSLSKEKEIILICGHYEGFDERIYDYIDMEISIGDFILTGGEIAAMTIIDSVSRLIENVIAKQSLETESFDDCLLDYPAYTKPIEYDNKKVPDILLSGNHKEITK
jgi:tRNA (guanine37-N1)-methyltransferase